MNIDDIDRELGGPLVVRERGNVLTLPSATDLTWRVVAAAVMDSHYFVGYIWPADQPLTAWKIEMAQEAWCRHNRLPGPHETRQLVHYVEKYHDALEYDLRTKVGVSLGDLWRDRRWRELHTYIQNLPADTKLNAMLSQDEEYLEAALRQAGDSAPSGPSMSEWNLVADQLATLIDAVRTNTEVTRAVAGGKPSQVKPYPRPRTKADQIRDRITRQQHEQMVSLLMPNKRAGMMQGSTPPPTE